MPAAPVTLDLERDLLNGRACLASFDEVGRGAHGPVAVGVAAITSAQLDGPVPAVRDSKALSPARRLQAADIARTWATGTAVGMASADEVDTLGILGALNVAACRALADLARAGITPDVALVDGSYDWLHHLPADHPALADLPAGPVAHLQIKADATCASVAAASVVAKTARDQLMHALAADYPGYGFAKHAGYLTAEHINAIHALGPSPLHRRTWRLPAAR